MTAAVTHFTADWFTCNAQAWLDKLGYMRDRRVQALEIGRYEGRSAHWLMSNILVHPGSTLLTCVDPWDGLDPCLGSSTYFDFIFIDGDHEGSAALTDLVLAWPLVNPGGWLIFDDYGWTGEGYNLRSLPSDAFDAWIKVKPPGIASVEPVGRLMFVKKEL